MQGIDYHPKKTKKLRIGTCGKWVFSLSQMNTIMSTQIMNLHKSCGEWVLPIQKKRGYDKNKKLGIGTCGKWVFSL